jgi:hypothetical protein
MHLATGFILLSNSTMETSIYKRVGNSTTLTFCGQDVAPEMVTRLLNWVPSESYRVGDARNGRLSELAFGN